MEVPPLLPKRRASSLGSGAEDDTSSVVPTIATPSATSVGRHARATHMMTLQSSFDDADAARAVATMQRAAEAVTAAMAPDAPFGCEAEDILEEAGLYDVYSDSPVVAAGMPLPAADSATRFHCVEYPAVPFAAYVARIAKRASFDADLVIYALALMQKAARKLPARRLTAHVLHRLFAACAFTATKMVWEAYMKVTSYARATGVQPADVVRYERRVMELCDWHVLLSHSDLVAASAGSDVLLRPRAASPTSPTLASRRASLLTTAFPAGSPVASRRGSTAAASPEASRAASPVALQLGRHSPSGARRRIDAAMAYAGEGSPEFGPTSPLMSLLSLRGENRVGSVTSIRGGGVGGGGSAVFEREASWSAFGATAPSLEGSQRPGTVVTRVTSEAALTTTDSFELRSPTNNMHRLPAARRGSSSSMFPAIPRVASPVP